MSGWQFWNREPREITGELRKALADEFSVESQEADELRLLQWRGKYGRQAVRYVLLFDPGEDSDAAPAKKKKFNDRRMRDGVQFAGRIERDGTVHLIDRREMNSAA